MTKTTVLFPICLTVAVVTACAPGQMSQTSAGATQVAHAAMEFGQGGQIKMLYDRRQHPQAVYLNDKLHIVFNAGGQAGAEPKARTYPMAITYDPLTRQFSEAVTLGPAKSDRHYCPVI